MIAILVWLIIPGFSSKLKHCIQYPNLIAAIVARPRDNLPVG